MSYKYDLVVIGGGNGGLMAACRASQMGLKTLLIEKNNTVGGAASTFVRGRFEFETTLHEIPGFGLGDHRSNLGKLFDELAIDVDWLPIKDAYRLIISDGNQRTLDATVPHGRIEFLSYMEKQCPGCKKSLMLFFDAAQKLREGLSYIGKSRGNVDMEVLKREHPIFCKIFTCSIDEFLHVINMPQKCIDILSAYWTYQGADMDTIDASRYLIMTADYFDHGAYLPKLLSHGIANRIQKRARELGCDFWLETEVTMIKTKNGSVCGIETSDGKVVDACAIISNAFPETIYSKLLDDKSLIPEFELRKVNARSYGFRGFSCYMGLDASPEQIGIKDYSVFINSTADTHKLFEDSSKRELMGDNISVTCLNIVNPDASPAGTTHLVFTAGFSSEGWDDITPENYTTDKRRIVDAMISRYEEVIGVEIRSHIEEISIATPITFARYMNTPQGVVYGYFSSRWDGMSARTLTGCSEPTIAGLWFVGAHAQQLSGYLPTLTSGDLAAKQVMGYVMGGGKR